MLKCVIECGLWLPQVTPQVEGVFGLKSLDDVIPGSWYIIPLPSTREVRYRMSIPLRIPSVWGFLGRIVACLMCWVHFKLTLLLQELVWCWHVWVGCGCEVIVKIRMSLKIEWELHEDSNLPIHSVSPVVFELLKSVSWWAFLLLHSAKVNGVFLLWILSQVS